MITMNRKTRNGRRIAGGGIAIAYNKSKVVMSELKIRRGKTEILCTSCKIPNLSRRLVILGIYMSPKLRATQRKEATTILSEAIATAKNSFPDPFIIITGDTNRMPIQEGYADYPDIVAHNVGPTRGGAYLDIVASNIAENELSFSIRPPLTTPEGLESDHNVIYSEASIINSDRFTKNSFHVRKRSKKADMEMRRWIIGEPWSALYSLSSAEEATTSFVRMIDQKMDELYPLKKVTIKSTDAPWMTKEIKCRIRSRKRTYKKEDKSDRWRLKKKETARLVKEAKKNYYNRIVKQAKESNDAGLYYKAVARLKSREAPTPFSPNDLFPNLCETCLLYTSPSPRDRQKSRMPSSA